MKVINEILEDLKESAGDLNNGQISHEEFCLKIVLMIQILDRIEINFEGTGIRSDFRNKRTTVDVQTIFRQLLDQRKYRAAEALRELQQPGISKRVFNNKIRKILASKLYFSPLERTIRKTMFSYLEKNGGYIIKENTQLFIIKGARIMNNDRLDYIKKYFEEDKKVKVQVPVFVSETSKGNVHYYFDGRRNGYDFKHGVAWVDRKDLHLFEGQHYIIHDGRDEK